MALSDDTTNIISCLKKHDAVLGVYLFGSRAKGLSSGKSDYDVAILTRDEQRPDADQVLNWRVDLEELLKFPVDIVLLNTASPIVVHQVLKNGLLLWCADGKFLARFVMRAQSEYADLKILRRPAEAAILKRKIYG